jgi:hypothetical protein
MSYPIFADVDKPITGKERHFPTSVYFLLLTINAGNIVLLTHLTVCMYLWDIANIIYLCRYVRG